MVSYSIQLFFAYQCGIGKLCFITSLYAFFLITACSEFDVLFKNFGNICIIIIYIVLLSHHFTQFGKTDTRHKNLIIALNKNMPPGSF